MASEIPLADLGKSTHHSAPTSRSGFYNPSYSGSKTSSRRPLYAPSHVDHADRNSVSRNRVPPGRASGHTSFTEDTVVPRRKLGFIQVTSLMVNGCVGNGYFFTTPGYVLALVRSKRICLVLWAIGAVYSALGMTVFLEYGIALPFNGGPLIYLDEVFHRPRLLATVIFALWWILFASTEAASKNVAQTILSLASNRSALELEDGLIKFASVIVQTVVCLILFFTPRLCFAFNTLSALYKIILMLVIFIAGLAATRRDGSGLNDFSVEYPGYNSKEVLTALVYIIECYQGWDNANYVSGEVNDYKRTLKWAGIATILILTCFNFLVTTAFFSVSDFANLTDEAGQANSARKFAQTVFGSTRGMEVATCLSSFSSLVFLTYTAAKVKQAIAWQRIIPFWRFFGQQNVQYDSPGGGLFLHWIFSVVPLLCLGKLSSDPRVFVSGIYIYGYEIMFVAMGVGLFWLKPRMRIYDRNWEYTYLRNKFLLVFVAVVLTALNVVVMVMTALPQDKGIIPRFYWPVALATLIVISTMYWAFLRLFQSSDRNQRRTIASRIGLEVHIYEQGDEVPEEMKFPMLEASLDGSRRRLQYRFSGPLAWCADGLNEIKHFFLRYLAY